MKKILITMQVPKSAIDKLKDFELDYNDSLIAMTKDEIINKVADVEAIFCPLSQKIDKDIIDAAKNLKIIANFGAGYDNIDIAYAREKNIVVTNAPAKHSAIATAELTMGLIIDLLRGISAGEKIVRSGEFQGWKPTYLLGPSLYAKKLGIFGLGNIGKRLVKLAQAFDMEVFYYSRTRKEELEKELNIKYLDFEELISSVDILSLHSAYTNDLFHLFDEKNISKMKKTAYLVNASRGPIVDEKALAKCLNNNIIAGAALDVYEKEPEVSTEILQAKNVLLAPHLGNASIEAREEMSYIAVENIILVLDGKEAKTKVN